MTSIKPKTVVSFRICRHLPLPTARARRRGDAS
jgi:hypothetical protein